MNPKCTKCEYLSGNLCKDTGMPAVTVEYCGIREETANVPLMSPKKKVPIFLLFTCDDWKSYVSMTLRGVFKTLNQTEKAKLLLKQNGIVNDAERNTHTVKSYLGEFYTDGSGML